jgi:carbon-monoxide dehydrogenase medium subunit
MIPGQFAYHRPRSVDDAVKLLTQSGDEGRVIAGGHSLIPMMKLRLALPGNLIDIQGIDALRGIREIDGRIAIGALTTQHEIIASDLLARKCPILKETALTVADPQVRYVGTIGGNVANGDPGNDMPAVMQCLDAVLVVQGPKGRREIPARQFYKGLYATGLAADEVLTEIRIEAPPAGHGWAYEKLKRKVGDYAVAAAAALLTVAGGVCRGASIALTNLGDTPLFATAAARALIGSRLDDTAIAAASAAAQSIVHPAADMRGSVAYRTHVAGVMVRRAVERARNRAKGA